MHKSQTTQQWLTALAITALACLAGEVSAFPEFMVPTGARSCVDCHLDEQGGGYQPGVLAATRSPLGVIAGLRAFLQDRQAPTNTAPVLHAINPKWDVTVGERRLVIPLQVTDKEDDSFALHGTVPTGYTVSSVYTRNGLPTVDFRWAPTAAQANRTYTVRLYVQETGEGRNLTSNTVSTRIQVWPARTTATRNIIQFMMQSAQWGNNRLTLRGQLAFRSGLSAAQRTAALTSLSMRITSANGTVTSLPVQLARSTTSSWTVTLPLTASQVPCTVRIRYEGLTAERPVSSAPATCVR